ncbi:MULTISPECIES: hypothetical protein [Streptomyces]|uniref:hypothetical protein n=1 Tax=Streptomyces TaxID=1883 RepID=UPI001679F3CF|nr:MULTISPECIES: hypothetical protein [Streptomyces]MCD2469551.1 hypothetical protein [Streptomyces sp. MBT42]
MGDADLSGHVEHVTVHTPAHTRVVLGVYVLADRLGEAEEAALSVCRRMLDGRPELAGWALVEGYVPLLAPVYDAFADDGSDRLD